MEISNNNIFEGEIKNGIQWDGKGYDRNDKIIYELNNGTGSIEEIHSNIELTYFGEYLNGKRNGKGKELEEDKLIFEGEYSNGEKNGYGKLYNYRGEIIFEGEYLDGKKWKGKRTRGYFHRYIYIQFEGEYLNGKQWNGKGYDEDGNIIYELNNGNGTIKEYSLTDKIKFEGEFLNGEKNGKAKEYNYEGNIIFEGEYSNGERSYGKEYDFFGNLIFEGHFLNRKRNGKGKEYFKNKLIYDGEYLNGERKL